MANEFKIKNGVSIAGTTSGTTIVKSNAVASGTLTLPATTDTLVGLATTDTLTNKTINGSNNTITNVSLTSGVTGTLPVANGGTGVTASSGANSVVLRDANQNTTINNIAFGTATTATAGGTTVLTVASSAIQNFTGSLSQNLNLPDATTLNLGAIYYINNNSAGSVVVNNNGGTPLYTVARGGATQLTLITNSTANGTWQQSAFIPNNVFWGSVALQATSTQAQFSSLTLGTALSVANGGTGQSSYTVGDILYASTTTALSKLSSSTSGYVLTSNGVGTAPTWQASAAGSAAAGSLTGSTLAAGVTASSLTSFGSSPTLTTPVIDNIKLGYATTATAAGTTTLTSSSPHQQFFTGSTTQTIVLPVTSTLTIGMGYSIENNSTGILTVQSSGANTIATIPSGVTALITVIATSTTTAADWDFDYNQFSTITGTGSVVLAVSPTFTGTPLAPTAAQGTNTTQVATTAFAIAEASAAAVALSIALG